MKEQQPNFVYMLTVLFIGLKLTGHIDWSWLWVFAPIWLSFTLAVFLGVVLGLWKVSRMNRENEEKESLR